METPLINALMKNMLMFIPIRNVFICSVVLLFFSAGHALCRDYKVTRASVPLVEVQLTGESLQDAAEEIARQTGYQIVIEKKWAAMPVSGVYHGVTVEDFFRRALKGENLSIISDDDKKIIFVRLFGAKKLDDLLLVPAHSGKKGNLDFNTVDPSDGQKISTIKELQAQYEAELERWKNDPDAIDPMDGQRMSEIRQLQAEHEVTWEQWKNDSNAVDPLDGQSLSGIRVLQEQHDEEVELWKKDPEAVDPEDGQKVSDIKEMQARHDAQVERWKNDPDAVDPMDGQKLSEIRRLQAEYDASRTLGSGN